MLCACLHSNDFNTNSDLDDGDVFMMASQRFSKQVPRYTATEAYDAFETLVFGEVTNTSLLRTLNKPETYATIFQNGK